MTPSENASTDLNGVTAASAGESATSRLIDLVARSSLLGNKVPTNADSLGFGFGGGFGGEQKDLHETMSALHSNSAFLPTDRIRSSLVRIAVIWCAVTTFYFVLVRLQRVVRGRLSPAAKAVAGAEGMETEKKEDRSVAKAEAEAETATATAQGSKEESSSCIWTSSYQATNLLINLTLGLIGLYHTLYTIPPRSATTVAQRIEGFDRMSIFAELQIAYQLWAIPVGYFLVNEHGAMLLHHVCVIVVSSLSAFFTNGFRYYNPFFYGLIELSSVPLAVMNAFKTNPGLARRHPTFHTAVRLTFAASFLTVRFVLWMPRICDYLHICGALMRACPTVQCRAGLGASWMSAVGLTALQLLWATKIVQGLARLVGPGGVGLVKGKTTKVA